MMTALRVPAGRFFGDEILNQIFGQIAEAGRPEAMRTDIKETDAAYELQMELPGFKKEDIRIELEDERLTISAEASEESGEKDKEGRWIRKERSMKSCSRSFGVGSFVTEEDVKAKFENGILTVTVPKIEAKPQIEEKKYIAIE